MFDILLFAAFAVFIAFKLYKVLGHKNFEGKADLNKDNVVSFPNKDGAKATDVTFEEIADDYEELKEKHGVEIANKIKELRKYDPSFSAKGFLSGAKSAFEIIINAFSKGDKKTLQPLLNKDLYKGFSEAIEERKGSGKAEETTLVSILASNIKSVALNKKYAKIVVEIVSEQINLIKNKKGEVIEGNPSQVDKISEVWTFSKCLTSKDPNWELIETGNA